MNETIEQLAEKITLIRFRPDGWDNPELLRPRFADALRALEKAENLILTLEQKLTKTEAERYRLQDEIWERRNADEIAELEAIREGKKMQNRIIDTADIGTG